MHIFSPQKPWVECKIGGRFDTFIWMVSGEFSYQRTNMLPAWCGPAAITTLKSRRTWPVLQHVDAGWTTHFLRDGTTKNFYFRRFPRKSYSTFNFQDLLHIYIYILYLGDGCINQMFMTKNSLHLAVVAFPKSANCWRSLCVYLPDHRLRWNHFFWGCWKPNQNLENRRSGFSRSAHFNRVVSGVLLCFFWKLSRLLDLLDSYKKSYCYC